MIFQVEHHGQFVSRDEIAARVWGNGVHVDVESGVSTAIRKIRSALKDSPEKPAFIETVPGKGYRFIGPVAQADPPEAPTPLPDRRRYPLHVTRIALAVAAVTALAFFVGFRHGGPSAPDTPVTLVVLPFQNLSSDPGQEYFSEGLTEETITALGRVTPSRIRFVPPSAFALVYTGLDDRDAAFHWLEKAYEVRDIGLVSLPVLANWDPLRSDKRFRSLMRRCRFPV